MSMSLDQLRAEKEKLEGTLKELEEERASWGKRVEELKGEVARLMDQFRREGDAVKASRIEISMHGISRQLRTAEDELSGVERRIRGTKSALEKVEGRIKVLTAAGKRKWVVVYERKQDNASI